MRTTLDFWLINLSKYLWFAVLNEEVCDPFFSIKSLQSRATNL